MLMRPAWLSNVPETDASHPVVRGGCDGERRVVDCANETARRDRQPDICVVGCLATERGAVEAAVRCIRLCTAGETGRIVSRRVRQRQVRRVGGGADEGAVVLRRCAASDREEVACVAIARSSRVRCHRIDARGTRHRHTRDGLSDVGVLNHFRERVVVLRDALVRQAARRDDVVLVHSKASGPCAVPIHRVGIIASLRRDGHVRPVNLTSVASEHPSQ